jgi:SAM-dependent methyltransferase
VTASSALDTSKRFGFEWHRYDEFFPHYEEQFLGWIEPLGPEDFQGRDVLDAGCGMGRNAYWAAKFGARSVVAADLAEPAVAAAREALKDLPGVRVECESIYELPYEEDFDVVFSIGVVHHLEFPRRAVERLVRALRPGGKLVVWLYGYEGNEAWVRFFRLLHPVLKRLPPGLLHALSYLVSVPIFLGVKLPFAKSPYLARVCHYPFAHLHKIVFDQLLPDIAIYYERHEVDELFAGLPLASVSVHHNRGYSWTVVAEK